MLHLESLHAGYGRGTVLHNITLQVAAGSVHALVGHNGAGKTTLINAIAGLHPTSRGRIHFHGRDLTRWPAHRRARAGIALVPQGRRMWASLTVAEHLAIATGKPRAGSGWTRDQLLALLPQLAARLTHRGSQLSGGEQQMLAIARALLTQPRLLLLDEPTEGLAPTVAAQIRTLITHIVVPDPNGEDLAVLLSASQPDQLTVLADTVTTLTTGAATTWPDKPHPDALRAALHTHTPATTTETRNP